MRRLVVLLMFFAPIAASLTPKFDEFPPDEEMREMNEANCYINAQLQLMAGEKAFSEHNFWHASVYFSKAEQSLIDSKIEDVYLWMRIKLGQEYAKLLLLKELELFDENINNYLKQFKEEE